MSNEERNPEVDTTIFPRINLLKEFKQRGYRRDANGRIFGPFRIYVDGEPVNPDEGAD